MSRIGNMMIRVPDGVTVNVADGAIQVKGPKGALSGPVPEGITAELNDGRLVFRRPDESKPSRARHGLARALANNMIVGVSDGFRRGLEIEGVGYRAEMKGSTLSLLLGFSHPVEIPVPEGLSVTVQGNTKLTIEGADKQAVGQFASELRSLRPPEPYKGKGVRYEDERIRRKVGKAGS